MKILKIFLTAVLVYTFGPLQAQDYYLRADEFPVEITSFVKEHFPNSDVVSIKREGKRKIEYEVKLQNREELEFDENFTIKDMESKMGLPDTVIPEKIRTYVAKNYPGKRIEEWKRKRKGQEIELDNGLEILFDFDGNFIKIDD